MSKQCTVHSIRDQASTEENYEKKYSKERKNNAWWFHTENRR